MRPLCTSFPEMSICKRYFDKTICMYFIIKEEKCLINIWKFGKKQYNENRV